MKKRLLFLVILLFIVVGCSKERTMEYLVSRYVEAYTKADMVAAKEIFPPFYLEYSKDILTKERLESEIDLAKKTYGDDFTITYKIKGNTKLTEEELANHNERMTNTYGAKENATECYRYEVNSKISGSIKEENDRMTTMGYCKYNGTWYIVEIG